MLSQNERLPKQAMPALRNPFTPPAICGRRDDVSSLPSRSRSTFPQLMLLACLSAGGCTQQSRTVTITTKPNDAVIHVAGVERGRGRVVQKFQFSSPGQAH